MSKLEDRLRDALTADAELCPEPPLEWHPRPSDAPQTASSPRRLLLAAACVAALGAAGFVALNAGDDSGDRVSTMTSVETAEPVITTRDESTDDTVVSDDPPPTTVPPSVLVIGAEVVVDAEDEIVSNGMAVDAVEGRSLGEVVERLDDLTASGAVGRSVVVDPTVFDPVGFADEDLDDLVEVFDEFERVVLVTSNAFGRVASDNNERLRSVAAAHANVSMLEWTVVDDECACTFGNGVDLRGDGPAMYAHLALQLTDPGYDTSTIRTTTELIQDQLEPIDAPVETTFPATDLFGELGGDNTIKVFGHPDRVCVADIDPDGGSGSSCFVEPSKALLLGVGVDGGSSRPAWTFHALHHIDVEVSVPQCDMRVVVLDELDAAMSGCVLEPSLFIDIEFSTQTDRYLITQANPAQHGDPDFSGLPDWRVAPAFNQATVDDWAIAEQVPTGFDAGTTVTSEHARVTTWTNASTGGRIVVSQILLPPGAEVTDLRFGSGPYSEDEYFLTTEGDGTRFDFYAIGVDSKVVDEFGSGLRLGNEQDVAGQIEAEPRSDFDGELVYFTIRRGEVSTLLARPDEANTWCIESSTAGQTCGLKLQDKKIMNATSNGQLVADDNGLITVSGIVDDQVGRVEVRFADGTIATAEPFDVRGSETEKFWSIEHDSNADTVNDSDDATALLDSVFVFDTAGSLLAVDRGAGPELADPFPLMSTAFVATGTPEELCTTAGVETSSNGDDFDGRVIADERHVITDESAMAYGLELRWLVCTGDVSSGWGINVLVSADSTNWELTSLGIGVVNNPTDTIDVLIDSGTATITYTSFAAERSATATTSDAGRNWLTVENTPE